MRQRRAESRALSSVRRLKSSGTKRFRSRHEDRDGQQDIGDREGLVENFKDPAPQRFIGKDRELSLAERARSASLTSSAAVTGLQVNRDAADAVVGQKRAKFARSYTRCLFGDVVVEIAATGNECGPSGVISSMASFSRTDGGARSFPKRTRTFPREIAEGANYDRREEIEIHGESR